MASTYAVSKEKLLDDAWNAHSALLDAQRRDPRLLANAAFVALRDTACARFVAALEAA